jgi:hypothetical protein
MEKCRLCATNTAIDHLLDIKSDIVQNSFQKCSIYIDSNKLLPQNCCLTCFGIIDKFSKFLDGIHLVEESLCKELNQKLTKVLVADENKEESFGINTETAAIYFNSLDIEIKDEFSDEQDTINPCKTKTKKVKTKKPKEKLEIKDPKSWKKYSMAEIFERELRQGSNKSLAHLKVSDDERNPDGSLNEFGLEKYGTFKWSDYVWNCVFCTENYPSLKELSVHSKRSHKCDPKYRCNSCGHDFVIYSAFHNHLIGHNPTLKFCCFFCSKFYQDLVSLYNHQEKDHGSSKHFCLYCGLISKTSGKLKDHVVLHLKPEDIKDIYLCDLCGKSFRTRKFVRAHILLHLSNQKSTRDFLCNFCGKSFTMKKYLHGHLLVHTVSKKNCQNFPFQTVKNFPFKNCQNFSFPNCQNNLFKFFSPIVHSNVKNVRKAINLEENWFNIASAITH